MFGVPGETEFDLRFRLVGIPVRVHPLFWVMGAILGQSARDGYLLLLWIGCVFLSILVHEFGHGLVARSQGAQPSVVLYSMGGLCLYNNSREGLWHRFFVLIMGPGAGFLLMGATMAVACLWLGITPIEAWNYQFFRGRTEPPIYAAHALRYLMLINLYWGIFNLMPIMPLDGGQIAMVFLTMHNRREGQRRAFILSVVTAGLLAIYFVKLEEYPNALLVGLLAFSSFQMLQALHYQSRYGNSFEDEADWWKR
jgi:stage IV sporulation protein FB